MTFWSIPRSFLCTNLCTFCALNNQKGLKIVFDYAKTYNIVADYQMISVYITQKLCVQGISGPKGRRFKSCHLDHDHAQDLIRSWAVFCFGNCIGSKKAPGRVGSVGY